MTGLVSADPCCPQDDPTEGPAGSSIGAPGCCDRVVVAVEKPAATHESDVVAPPALTTGALVSERTDQRPSERAGGAPGADAARIVRPPLRLLKRSFQI
ncbi:MAG: hypothetical protein JWM82_23 [Myxococcales bacterium]|nr:hypothetical protein [Myxococcales bacterium]